MLATGAVALQPHFQFTGTKGEIADHRAWARSASSTAADWQGTVVGNGNYMKSYDGRLDRLRGCRPRRTTACCRRPLFAVGEVRAAHCHHPQRRVEAVGEGVVNNLRSTSTARGADHRRIQRHRARHRRRICRRWRQCHHHRYPLECRAVRTRPRRVRLSGSASMTDPAQIDELAADLDRLDVLVNNAGQVLPRWQQRVRPRRVRRGALPSTSHRGLPTDPALSAPADGQPHDGGAAVVNLASMASFFGIEFVPGYGAAKAGGRADDQDARRRLGAREGIRVNAVAPGLIESNMTAPMLPHEALRNRTSTAPHWADSGQPDDVAPAVLFLAVERSPLHHRAHAHRRRWLLGQGLKCLDRSEPSPRTRSKRSGDDGVVCLRGALPIQLLAAMEPAGGELLELPEMADLSAMGDALAAERPTACCATARTARRGRFVSGVDHWRRTTAFRRFACDSRRFRRSPARSCARPR